MLEQFGHALFEKGNYLFRRYRHTLVDEVMFFAFRPSDAISNTCDNQMPVQVWQTVSDLKLITFIGAIRASGTVKSNIATAHRLLWQIKEENNFSDLEIKNRPELLLPFIRQLRFLGVDGWLTSIEGKTQMEIFLFNMNSEKVHLVTLRRKYLDECSMHKIKLFPSKEVADQLMILETKLPAANYSVTDHNADFIKENDFGFTIRDIYANT